ncbi:MAG TPA: hypothetical protein VGE07_12295 [Herpetosiphonaceae bacterium]
MPIQRPPRRRRLTLPPGRCLFRAAALFVIALFLLTAAVLIIRTVAYGGPGWPEPTERGAGD